jgi:RNase P protein component
MASSGLPPPDLQAAAFERSSTRRRRTEVLMEAHGEEVGPIDIVVIA